MLAAWLDSLLSVTREISAVSSAAGLVCAPRLVADLVAALLSTLGSCWVALFAGLPCADVDSGAGVPGFAVG